MALDDAQRAHLAWLTADEDELGVFGPREQLGRYLLDLDSGWYRDESNLEAVLAFARTHDCGALHAALEQAIDTSARLGWLDAMVQAARYTAPQFDANYGLYYRYDRQTGAYEWAASADTPCAEWMSQSAADAHAALHSQQSESTAGSHEQSASGAGQTEAVDWAWDENWAMFYRIGAGGVYEYAHSADQARTAPVEPWLSGEQVLRQRERAAQAAPVVEPGQGTVREVILARFADIRRELPDFDEYTDAEIAQAVAQLLQMAGE
jgi:hypothetical protein